MKRHRHVFIAITLFFGVSSMGLTQHLQPLKDYVVENWSSNEGLPSNNLNHITQDPMGFLWISTFNGCLRFDGKKFRMYDSNNIPDITLSAFYTVTALPDTSIYMATQSSGIIKFKNGVFTRVFENSILPNPIQFIYPGPKRLWIGTRNHGIYYVEDGEVYQYSIPELDTKSIMSFSIDIQGNVWVASEGNGVVKISDSGYDIYTVKDGLASNIVNSIVCHDGTVYAGTAKGLSMYSNDKWTNDGRLRNVEIKQIVTDKHSNLWFATGIGLARISRLNEFEMIGEHDGLPSRLISSLVFDNEDNIWLTTDKGGLVQLKKGSFTRITIEDKLNVQSINIVSEAPDGRYFIGSNNGQVNIYDKGKISNLKLKSDLTNTPIKDILVEEGGTTWIATYNGVIKKTANEEKLLGISDGLISLRTRCFTKDSNNVLWIASRNGGINKIYPDGRIESISIDDGLGSDFIFSFDETPDGRMVVGTANGGLNIFHKDGSIEIKHPDATITGLSIFNVLVENNNLMWLATNVGLYCYEKGQFYLIGVNDGLKAETVFDIIEDAESNFWMSSILGMVKLSKKEALDYVHGKRKTVSTALFDESDGMISSECTAATRSLLASDGSIWIPTIKGVAIVDPKQIVVSPVEPTVFIDNVLIDDVAIEPFNFYDTQNSVTISPGHRSYQIEYGAISLYSPGKVQFKYKLDGFDKEWVDAGLTRQAKYTNLPYGTYTFKVIAANNNGAWSDEQAMLNVVVEPYFYETRTFVVVVILAFIVLTIAMYMMQTAAVQGRNKELVKLNRELDSFAYSVSHDLKAPLTSIQGLLNVARLDNGENSLTYYDRIEESVDKLDSFIKDIIDYSKNSRLAVKKEEINLKSLIVSMVEGLSYLANGKEIKSILDISDDLIIKTDKTRLVFILNNLLTNAFRYADMDKEEPFVKVVAHTEGNKLELSIIDNGQGIKKEHQSKIFDMFYRANEGSSGSGLGLYIVMESINRLKGKIMLDSKFGIGTTVKVILPHVVK